MSDPKVEISDFDPPATSAGNYNTANNGKDAPVATATNEPEVNTDPDVAMKDTESDKSTNEKAEVKSEQDTSKKPKVGENGVLRTTGQVRENFSKNSKFDASILPMTNDPVKIRNQVEFYFSDSNMATDVGMMNLTGGTENKFITIEFLCTRFNRMKRFRPIEDVIAALKDSQFLEVGSDLEGKDAVKRKKPWQPSPALARDSRSIYAKGFGDEEASTQFDAEAFFAPYGPTNNVQLRRSSERLFKGSVFVEFQDNETAQKFLALDPKPLWRGKHNLIIKPKRDYLEEKNESLREGSTEPSETRRSGFSNGRGGGRGRGRDNRHNRDRGHGDRDPDNWKKRREYDQSNGFKDRKGRGGGRNNRARGNDRGPRNNDRNRGREEREGEKNGEKSEAGEKEVQAETKESKADVAVESKVDAGSEKTENGTTSEQGKNEKKRAREDDGEGEDKPAKKVDTKEVKAEAGAEESKVEFAPKKTEQITTDVVADESKTGAAGGRKKAEEVNAENLDTIVKNEKKRLREDDGEVEKPAKKVDTKSEATAEAS